MKKNLVLLGLVLVSLIFTIFIAGPGNIFGKAEQVGPAVGLKAPEFTLSDTSGKKVTLKEVVAQNKVTLVNFWATWCPPCRAEIPELIAFYQKYSPQKVALLGINLQENLSEVKGFVTENKMNFPILMDSKGSVGDQYQVSGIPTTFFLDSTGKIRQKIVGSTDQKTVEGIVKKLLQEK